MTFYWHEYLLSVHLMRLFVGRCSSLWNKAQLVHLFGPTDTQTFKHTKHMISSGILFCYRDSDSSITRYIISIPSASLPTQVSLSIIIKISHCQRHCKTFPWKWSCWILSFKPPDLCCSPKSWMSLTSDTVSFTYDPSPQFMLPVRVHTSILLLLKLQARLERWRISSTRTLWFIAHVRTPS